MKSSFGSQSIGELVSIVSTCFKGGWSEVLIYSCSKQISECLYCLHLLWSFFHQQHTTAIPVMRPHFSSDHRDIRESAEMCWDEGTARFFRQHCQINSSLWNILHQVSRKSTDQWQYRAGDGILYWEQVKPMNEIKYFELYIFTVYLYLY